MANTDDGPMITLRPGAIISLEGERVGRAYVIDAGVVEESMGFQVIGSRGAGDEVPRTSHGRAEVTTRAVTLVRLRPTT